MIQDIKDTNFDDFSNSYNAELGNNLNKIPLQGDISFFAKHKIEILSEKFSANESYNILDFGCGIGRNIPYLSDFFPKSNIYGTDISLQCLNYAKLMYPNANFFELDTVPVAKFDIILVADVLHHVNDSDINDLIIKLCSIRSNNSAIVVFEQNPYNPITRYLVNTCPFDKNVRLLSLTATQELFLNHGLIMKDSGYCFFFPSSFKRLYSIESKISKIPVGGKYFAIFR